MCWESDMQLEEEERKKPATPLRGSTAGTIALNSLLGKRERQKKKPTTKAELPQTKSPSKPS